MSVKAMDQVFNRWFLDGDFRAQMNENRELALSGYDLTDVERTKMSRLSKKNRRRGKAKKMMVKTVPQKSFPRPNVTCYQLPDSRISSFNLN